MRSTAAIAIVAMAISIVPIAGLTQTPPASPQPFRLGLGDMMTITIQPRHTKLGLAGREKNWAYATYELHELEESFDRIARFSPTARGKPVAEMIKSATGEALGELSQAIKAGDATKFSLAYQKLTDGCNSCHRSFDLGVIVIQAPKASPFPDQNFRPTKP